MIQRKGLGKGLGMGYKNIAPMDSHIHSLSAKGVKSYPTLKAFEKDIKKGNIFDVVKVDGVIYTQDFYDMSGKEISYGNKSKNKGIRVETEDRYKQGFGDAEVYYAEDPLIRTDISYVDAKGKLFEMYGSKWSVLKKGKDTVLLKNRMGETLTITREEYEKYKPTRRYMPVGEAIESVINAKTETHPFLMDSGQLIKEFDALVEKGEKGKLRNEELKRYYDLSNELTIRGKYKETKTYKDYLEEKSEKSYSMDAKGGRVKKTYDKSMSVMNIAMEMAKDDLNYDFAWNKLSKEDRKKYMEKAEDFKFNTGRTNISGDDRANYVFEDELFAKGWKKIDTQLNIPTISVHNNDKKTVWVVKRPKGDYEGNKPYQFGGVDGRGYIKTHNFKTKEEALQFRDAYLKKYK